jgi:hypothetical protein
MHHLNVSYRDVMSMPVSYRKWFIQRVADEYKDAAEARKKRMESRKNTRAVPMGEIASTAHHSNSPVFSSGPKSFK